MRGNAAHLTVLGRGAGALIVHILFGMIIGAFVAISPPAPPGGPLAAGLVERITQLGHAFRGVVFSQIKISAVNTILTAIFLGVVLPLAGRPLPFAKTMIAVTFVVGLLPIIGNLISEHDHRARRARRLGLRCGDGARLPHRHSQGSNMC